MKIEPNTFHCCDCLEFMRELPDKCVDLVLTDPPYGKKIAATGSLTRGLKPSADSKRSSGKRWTEKKRKQYPRVLWDDKPIDSCHIAQLFRVGKNCIVWGGNYIASKVCDSSCWLVWDKNTNGEFADCELAWTSFAGATRIFRHTWDGFRQESYEYRYHPTQKPVPLFKWCLSRYSQPGALILDPFCGSGTTALACHALGRQFICVDREPEYIEIAKRRYAECIAQQDLFLNGAKTGDAESGATSASTPMQLSAFGTLPEEPATSA